MVSIEGGGDWTDASYEIIYVPKDMNLELEGEKWREWYEKIYCPKLSNNENPEFIPFTDWLIKNGGERVNLETFQEP